MSGPNYCRVLDAQQKDEVDRTGVIPTCPTFEQCSPYAAGSVVFLVDMSVAREEDIAKYALAKHSGFNGQEIWRLDFTDPNLVTEPDKTKGAWNGAVVAFGPVAVPRRVLTLIHAAKNLP
jgi:hypothetical protein